MKPIFSFIVILAITSTILSSCTSTWNDKTTQPKEVVAPIQKQDTVKTNTDTMPPSNTDIKKPRGCDSMELWASCDGWTIYAGARYMVTPAWCSNAFSPVCTGTVDTQKYTIDEAKIYCDNLRYWWYTDWRLPSKDELNLLYQNRLSIGWFASKIYWSSTEDTYTLRWFQNFETGNQSSEGGYQSELVRCIRRM